MTRINRRETEDLIYGIHRIRHGQEQLSLITGLDSQPDISRALRVSGDGEPL